MVLIDHDLPQLIIDAWSPLERVNATIEPYDLVFTVLRENPHIIDDIPAWASNVSSSFLEDVPPHLGWRGWMWYNAKVLNLTYWHDNKESATSIQVYERYYYLERILENEPYIHLHEPIITQREHTYSPYGVWN
jgi:hypothetical protein